MHWQQPQSTPCKAQALQLTCPDNSLWAAIISVTITLFPSRQPSIITLQYITLQTASLFSTDLLWPNLFVEVVVDFHLDNCQSAVFPMIVVVSNKLNWKTQSKTPVSPLISLNLRSFIFLYYIKKMGNRCWDLLKHVQTNMEIQHLRQKRRLYNSNELEHQ